MPTTLDQLRGWLLTNHAGTVCRDRLTAVDSLVRELARQDVPGEFVEVGCYKGAMTVWLRALLDDLGREETTIHVFDSFAGLPEPGKHDSQHLAVGELVADPGDVNDIHRHWGLVPPVIHPGWFADTLPDGLPKQIAFAYLDGDFYDSIMTSLTCCVPLLTPGGLIVVDDYADTAVNPQAWDGLPGVKRACDEYFGRPGTLEVMIGDDDLAFGLYRKRR
jgi:O-methyltransferase